MDLANQLVKLIDDRLILFNWKLDQYLKQRELDRQIATINKRIFYDCEDIWSIIVEFLDTKSVICLAATNKTLNQFVVSVPKFIYSKPITDMTEYIELAKGIHYLYNCQYCWKYSVINGTCTCKAWYTPDDLQQTYCLTSKQVKEIKELRPSFIRQMIPNSLVIQYLVKKYGSVKQYWAAIERPEPNLMPVVPEEVEEIDDPNDWTRLFT